MICIKNCTILVNILCATSLGDNFFISSCFDTVTRILKSCVVYRIRNTQAMEIYQNSYRDFRSDSVKIPFRTIFIDYIGPFHINVRNENIKVYILNFTWLFSRGVAHQIWLSFSLKNKKKKLNRHSSYMFISMNFRPYASAIKGRK